MDIKIDPRLEERYLEDKYGENIDIELARMYDRAKRTINQGSWADSNNTDVTRSGG